MVLTEIYDIVVGTCKLDLGSLGGGRLGIKGRNVGQNSSLKDKFGSVLNEGRQDSREFTLPCEVLNFVKLLPNFFP